MDSFNLPHTHVTIPLCVGRSLRFAPRFTGVMGKGHTPMLLQLALTPALKAQFIG